jgi:Dolichyl-phosphate-mannose-protein mannosyltransferase
MREHEPSLWLQWLPALALVTAVTSLLLWLYGDLLVFTNDEGILLEAAQRMLRGQKLYVDFFGYMSPGSYWLHELALRLFGATLRSGRIVMILGFAVQCAFVLWLTSHFTSRSVAWACATFFIVFQISQPALLIPNHRIDSAAISLVSIAFCLQGFWTAKRRWWIAGGASVVLATLCTPSIALVAMVTVGWLLCRRELRCYFWSYAGGVLFAAVLFIGIMASTGILLPFLNQMVWLRTNYSEVNWMRYGSIIGGYSASFRNLSPSGYLIHLGILVCFALPAILPILVLAGWVVEYFSRRQRQQSLPKGLPVWYLLACVVAYVTSTLPRPDITHLAFVAALSYALAAILIGRYLSVVSQTVVLVLLLPWAAAVGGRIVVNARGLEKLESAVGTLRVNPADADGLKRLQLFVKPGDRIFVHPYMPLLYFLTQAENPSRFSFLAPGMMSEREERTALLELQAKPPKSVLYLRLEREEFLRIFPNAARLDHRFRNLERWIELNYSPLDPPLSVAGYELWTRRTAPDVSASAESPSSAKPLY